MPLDQFYRDHPDVFSEVRGETGRERMARVERREPHRIKPQRADENNRGAESAFRVEMPNESLIGPVPQKGMQRSKED